MTNTKWAISLVTFALLAGCATPPDPCPDRHKITLRKAAETAFT